MARMLTGLGGREQRLRVVEMADGAATADEHVERRLLAVLGVLAGLVPVVGVGVRGKQPETGPAAHLGKGADALRRRLGHHRQVDPLRQVRRRAVERV